MVRAAGVTPREAEVLEAVGARLTNAEIAERLYISIRTVESHVSALLRKLAEPDRRALVARAQTLLTPERPPLPSVVAAAIGARLVGRGDELERLSRLAELTRSAHVRRLAVVLGDAGIGKTRLATEAAARLHGDGTSVLHGRCSPEALIPYQPFIEAVEPLGTEADLVPETSPADDDAAARYRLFEDFDRSIAASGAPVVLVLDDVHWMDASALALLRHLLHHADRSAMLVIATARPEVTDPRHPWSATIGGAEAARVDLLTLTGLSRNEALTLAADADNLDENRVAEAWERTGGNPFLLAELLRHHRDGGLPPSAQDAIVRRVAGLGAELYEALAAAAVYGDTFDVDVLAAATGSDPERHAAAVEQAFRAGLVTEGSADASHYRFAHAIVREALVAVTTPSQRVRLHLGLAEALGPLRPAVAADIARHRHAALPAGDPARARRAALAASEHATSRLAHELAATFAGMALDAIDAGGGDELDRIEVLLQRGAAHRRAGNLQNGIADHRHAFGLATQHKAQTHRARAALGWADSVPVWGRDPELFAAIEAVLEDGLDDIGLRARSKAKLAQLLYYGDDGTRQAELRDGAIADARQSGQRDVLADVLATSHATLSDPADLDDRVTLAREAIATATASHQLDLERQGFGWLAVDLLEGGDLVAAERALARHAQLADQLRQRVPLRDVELWAAMRAILHGRFTDASEHIERARDLGQAAGDPATDSIYWVQRYWLAIEQDDASELDELVDPCARISRQNPDVPAWRAATAMLHSRRRDRDGAIAEYEAVIAAGLDTIPRDAVWLNALTYLAETCAFLHDVDRSPQLFAALEPYADRLALIDRALACKGSVRRFLGLLAATHGDMALAEANLRDALAVHDALGATPLLERTSRDLQSVIPG